MSNDNKTPNNVLQFPGPKSAPAKPATPAPVTQKEEPPKPPKAKSIKKTTAGAVVAIALMTVAVNKYTFSSENSANLSSTGGGRTIASINHDSRDAAWEKALAERLASAQIREVASVSIGRPATKEEKLRWGVLEEKYTISYDNEEHKIRSILLQDEKSSPSYMLDRSKFLNEFGTLFSEKFESAKLKSIEKSEDKTVEAYTLFDKENNPKGEARFELDRHKRLISLKVEPIKI